MKKVLAPLGLTVLIAMVLTTALFFYVGLAAGDMSAGGSRSVDLGPLRFLTFSREVLPDGSAVSLVPGFGLALMWGLLIAYGLVVGLGRARAGAPTRP